MNKSVSTYFFLMLQNSPVQLLILAIIILNIYGHSLNAPFYLDDYPSIHDNLHIHTLNLNDIWNYAPFRFVTYTSFALNYHFHQLDVFGYHLVNMIIHFLVGCGIYYFVKVLICIPKINLQASNDIQNWLPFLSALIFIIHPLHTQAVTYIVQRLASLAALFYILSIAFYIHARLIFSTFSKKIILFSCAIIFATLALFTKENTVTLIMIIPCIELVFFQKTITSRFVIMGSILITFFSFWMLYGFIRNIDPFSLTQIDTFTRLGTDISRSTYLYTQLKIIWIYIRLFFFPIGLHLDYDILPGSPDWTVFIALTGHLVVMVCAFMMRKQQPVILFSILFYYTTHLIESSIIPIKDFCFEHRAYLPDIGLSILCAYIIINTYRNACSTSFRYTIIGLLTIIFSVFGMVTWQRNHVWNDPIAFWQNCSIYSPQKTRVWAELGKHLMIAKQNKKAIAAFNNALRYSVDSSGQQKLNVQIICNLIILLHKTGDSEKAIHLADQALQHPINNLFRFYILNNKIREIYFLKTKILPGLKHVIVRQ